MNFGSLFSGIGGLDLGLERAGMICKWQVEIDPFCTKVLEKHWPNVRRYGDIKEIKPEELEPVDLVCGGFPCQPVSVAGKRKAQEDARWLWPEFFRVLGALRPRYVLVENVPGLRSAGQGAAFAEVLADLARLRYDAEWIRLGAAAIGAPHLRYRIFIVAYALEDASGAQRDTRSEVAKELLGDAKDRKESDHADRPSEDVADATLRPAGFIFGETGRSGQGTSRGKGSLLGRFDDWWATEPSVGRVAHGVPARVDRLRSLGNAVVPQVAEWVGRQILNG